MAKLTFLTCLSHVVARQYLPNSYFSEKKRIVFVNLQGISSNILSLSMTGQQFRSSDWARHHRQWEIFIKSQDFAGYLTHHYHLHFTWARGAAVFSNSLAPRTISFPSLQHNLRYMGQRKVPLAFPYLVMSIGMHWIPFQRWPFDERWQQVKELKKITRC